MFNAILPLTTEPHGRRYTVADLAAMPNHLPSGDIDFELHRGKFVVVDPFDFDHGRTHACLLALLSAAAEDADHGHVYGRVGIIVSRNPDTVLAPDVSFIARHRLPVRTSPEEYLETIPDLVVEIRSRTDTTEELDAKAAAYLAAGVRVVWVVDPGARTITSRRCGCAPEAYAESDVITCRDVLSGMRLPVGEVFRD